MTVTRDGKINVLHHDHRMIGFNLLTPSLVSPARDHLSTLLRELPHQFTTHTTSASSDQYSTVF
jgi:hypothetical protein